jgi:cytochrome P450
MVSNQIPICDQSFNLLPRTTGPVVRQGPNRLIFNTITAFRGKLSQPRFFFVCRMYSNSSADIYLHPGVTKAKVYSHSQFSRTTNLFGTVEKNQHRQKRKLYGQALSDRSIRAFEPSIIEEINILLRQILQAGEAPVDISPRIDYLTADIAGQLAFGQPLRTQTEETNRILPRAMLSVNVIISMCSKLVAPPIWFILLIDSHYHSGMASHWIRARHFTYSELEERSRIPSRSSNSRPRPHVTAQRCET